MSRPDRLHHMDAVRCFCMLFGLMVHGATLGDNWLFEMIKSASGLFRMAAFFLVSGFFAAMVAARQPVADFLANRARLLLVPLVAGLLLLNPITNWLIHWFHGNPMSLAAWFAGGWRQALPPPAQSVWHLHLWFLFSLMAYALLTPVLSRLAAARAAAQLVDTLLRFPAWSRPMLLGLAVGIAAVALRGLHDQLPKGGGPFAYIIGATFGYLPFFAIGLWAFRDRRLYEMLHAFPWLALALFGALHLGHSAIAPGLPHGAERMLFWLSRTGFSFAIVVAMLALARRWVTRGSRLLSALTDGVYSFYMFHFLAIYAIAVTMQAVTSNVYLIFAIVLLVGYPLLFAIHRRLVAPHPWMAFLWNGKPMPSARKSVG